MSAAIPPTFNDSNPPLECYDLQESPQWLLTVHTIVVSIIIFASLVGSGIVLLLVSKYKELRCRTVIASLSVVAVDLFFDLTYHFPALISTVARRWLFTDVGCMAIGFMGHEFLITRWMIMAVLCIDRFCTVRFPFKYEKYSKCVLIWLTLVAWILPFILSIPSVVGNFGNVGFRRNIPTCAVDCQNGGCAVYFRVLTTTSVVIGGVLPILLYAWMYYRARRLRPTAMTLGQLSIQLASGAIVSQPIAQLEQSSRDREFRAILTFALIFVTVLATAIPAYIFLILRTANEELWCRIPLVVHFVGIEIFLLATALDPILILRDRDFRRCLNDLFCHCIQSDTHRQRELVSAVSPSASNDPLHRLSSSQTSTSNSSTDNNEFICNGTVLTSVSKSPESHVSCHKSPMDLEHEETTSV